MGIREAKAPGPEGKARTMRIRRPRWIDFGGTWREFCAAELALAGTAVRIGEETVLIGHINEYGGVCDDCRMFDRDSVIDAYAVVVEDIGTLR